MIQGTVMDMSPASAGTPAISDASMDAWMEFMHLGKPRPLMATGVEVVISAYDPNYNYYELGRVTSDAAGMFKLMFEPQVPGEYTVIATFEGSDSYWPSGAECAIGVTETPTSASAQMMPELVSESTEAPLFTTTGLAIIVAVAVAVAIGVVSFWALKKRK